MDFDSFLDYLRDEIVATFKLAKAGRPDDKHKYRTEGLIQAARKLGLLTHEQASDLVEREHQMVFGCSVAERKGKKAELAKLKETSPDQYYEMPAYERLR